MTRLDTYFWCFAVTFHIAAAAALALTMLWLFAEWYLNTFKFKREFLAFCAQRLRQGRSHLSSGEKP